MIGYAYILLATMTNAIEIALDPYEARVEFLRPVWCICVVEVAPFLGVVCSKLAGYEGDLLNCAYCLLYANITIFLAQNYTLQRLWRRLLQLLEHRPTMRSCLEHFTGLNLLLPIRIVQINLDDAKRKPTPAWRKTAVDTTSTASSETPSIMMLPNELLTMIARRLPATIDRAAMMSTCCRLRNCLASLPNFWPSHIDISIAFEAQCVRSDTGWEAVSEYTYHVNEMCFKNADQMESAAAFLLKHANIDALTIRTRQLTYPITMLNALAASWQRAERDVLQRTSKLIERRPAPSVWFLCIITCFQPDYTGLSLLLRRLSHSLREVAVANISNNSTDSSHSGEQCAVSMIDAIAQCKKLRQIILHTMEFCHAVPLDRFLSAFCPLECLEFIDVDPRLLPPRVNALGRLLNESQGLISAVGLKLFYERDDDAALGYELGQLDTLLEEHFSSSARLKLRRLTSIHKSFARSHCLNRLPALLPNVREFEFILMNVLDDRLPDEELRTLALAEFAPLRMAFLRRHTEAAESQNLFIRFKHSPMISRLTSLTQRYLRGNATVHIHYKE